MVSPETIASEAFWEKDRPEIIARYRESSDRPDRHSLSQAIRALEPDSVLDVGCHCGPILARLRADGYSGSYTGFDINCDAILAARDFFAGDTKAEFLVGNARKVLASFPDESDDVICCSSVLSHLAPEDAQSLLEEMVRCATVAVVIQEPTDRCCAQIPSWSHDYPAWFKALQVNVIQYPEGVCVVSKREEVDELNEETLALANSYQQEFKSSEAEQRLGRSDLRTKKIAIVGFAPSTRDMAPFDDQSFEIWGQNHFAFFQKRCDRIFELHDAITIKSESDSGEGGRGKNVRDTTGYIDSLRNERVRPIYMLDVREDIPASVRFPIEKLTAFFGEYCDKLRQQPYITSSFGHMIGFAIMKLIESRQNRWVPEGEELHVYGVDLLSDEEYAYQRANAEFFGGYCIGAGIRLHIPMQSAIFSNAGVYGYSLGEAVEPVSRILHHLIKRRGLMLNEVKQFDAEAQKAAHNVNAANSQLNELNKILAWLETIMRGGVIERPWSAT